jgi:hypothetical protein
MRFYAVKLISTAGTTGGGEVALAEINAVEDGLPSWLEDTRTTHITCRLWCSCQFDRHSGGPCAHMHRVYQHENVLCLPDGVVHRRWLLADADRENRAVTLECQRALAALKPVPQPSEREAMTAGERYEDLSACAHLLCDVGALTPTLYGAVSKRMRDILTALGSGNLVPESNGTAAQKRAREAVDAAAAAGAPVLPRAPPAPAASRLPIVDHADPEDGIVQQQQTSLKPPARKGGGAKRRKGVSD